MPFLNKTRPISAEEKIFRQSGIDIVGDIKWGSHFSQFYQTQKDLLDILVPYFRAGLENGEFCVWVTSDFLTREEALAAMRKEVPAFDDCLERGQIEIFPYTDWYVKKGKFEMNRVLKQWLKKYDEGIKKGYAGLRVSGNPFWIDNKKDWDDFAVYESHITDAIRGYKLLVLCTYSLEKCSASEIIDVVTNHEFALIKKSGKWEVIESAGHRKIEQALRESEEKYRALFESIDQGFCTIEVLFDRRKRPVDYRFLMVNPAFERQAGIKNVVGKRIKEIAPLHEKYWFEIFGKIALTGKPMRFENAAGQPHRYYDVYAWRVGEPSERKVAILFSDITERRKTNEKIQHLASFPLLNPNPVIETDLSGEIIYANPAALRVLEERDLGDDPRVFLPADMPEILRAWTEKKEETKNLHREVNVKDKSFDAGVTLWKKLNFARIYLIDVTERKRAIDAIQESEEKFKMAIENSSDHVIITNPDGYILDANRAAEKITGFSRKEIIGKKAGTKELWGGNMPPEFYKKLWHTIKNEKKVFYSEIVNRRKNGEMYTAEANIAPVLGRNGEIRYFVGTERDVTEKRRAEEDLRKSEARYRSLFEGSALPVWEEDFSGVAARFSELRASGVQNFREYLTEHPEEVRNLAAMVKVVDVSPASLEVLGVRDKKELFANLSSHFYKGDSWNVFREEIIALAEGKTTFRCEMSIKGARGEPRVVFLHLSVAPGEEKTLSRVLITFVDITDSKNAEEAKNNFIAMMSHELRNPLTPIVIGTDLVRENLEKTLPRGKNSREVMEQIDVIKQQAKNISRILDDLLDISRISRGAVQLKMERVNLSDCIKRAVFAVDSLVKKQSHLLTVFYPKKPVYLKVDPVRIEQVLTNLLNNAVKYTKKGGKISLRSSLAEGHVKISVKDNGVGIPREKINLIFNSPARTMKPFASTQGELGIGLKLAKDLVAMHGGAITVKSPGVNKGAEFIVSLPVPESSRVEKSARVANETKRTVRSKPRILVVEDNKNIAKLISAALSNLGYKTKTCYGGESALALITKYRPGMAFVDLGLSGMNGYELAKKLREREMKNGSRKKREMKLIALTGYGQEEYKKRSREAGFDIHLVKPVNMETLRKTVADLSR